MSGGEAGYTIIEQGGDSIARQLERYAADFSQLLSDYEALRRMVPAAGNGVASVHAPDFEAMYSDLTDFGFVSTDTEGTVIKASLGAANILGCLFSAMVGARLDQLLPLSCRLEFLRNLALFLDPLKLGSQISLPVREGGGDTHLLMYAMRESAVQNINWVFRITSETRPGAQIGRIIKQEHNDAVLITGADWVVRRINKAFVRLSGYDQMDVLGRPARFLQCAELNGDLFESIKQDLQLTGEWRGQVWHQHKNGNVFPEWIHVLAATDANGATSSYVVVFVDWSIAGNVSRQANHLSHYDSLTGLPNRTLFLERLGHAIYRAKARGQAVGVLYVDLDNFGDVNGKLGLGVGDQALIHVADRIQSSMRQSDFVARMCNEEFAVLVEGISQPTDVHRIAEKLAQSLDRPFSIGQVDLHICCSVGISCYPWDAEQSVELLQRANSAMSMAKSPGQSHGRYRIGVGGTAGTRKDLCGEISQAFEDSEFSLAYQPQVDSDAGTVIGVEVLLRWNSPVHGSVSPNQFIPLAENTGMIIPIGYWVLEMACEQHARWARQGLGRFRMAVNISVRQICDEAFVEKVMASLTREGMEPEFLELEVTESLLMESLDASVKNLQELKRLGVGIAVDDFGTGYSSLGRLRHLPVSKLKIDRSFVHDMIGDRHSEAITDAIVALATHLDMNVVAEGVEDVEQVEKLRLMGCHLIQGYFVAKPMSANAFESWVMKSQWLSRPSDVLEHHVSS